MKFYLAAHDQSFEVSNGDYWTWKHPSISRRTLDRVYYEIARKHLPVDPNQLGVSDLHGGYCSIDQNWICLYRIVNGGRDLKNRPGRFVLLAAVGLRSEVQGRNPIGVLNSRAFIELATIAPTKCPLPPPPSLEIDYNPALLSTSRSSPVYGRQVDFRGADPPTDAIAACAHLPIDHRFDCWFLRRGGSAQAALLVEPVSGGDSSLPSAFPVPGVGGTPTPQTADVTTVSTGGGSGKYLLLGLGGLIVLLICVVIGLSVMEENRKRQEGEDLKKRVESVFSALGAIKNKESPYPIEEIQKNIDKCKNRVDNYNSRLIKWNAFIVALNTMFSSLPNSKDVIKGTGSDLQRSLEQLIKIEEALNSNDTKELEVIDSPPSYDEPREGLKSWAQYVVDSKKDMDSLNIEVDSAFDKVEAEIQAHRSRLNEVETKAKNLLKEIDGEIVIERASRPSSNNSPLLTKESINKKSIELNKKIRTLENEIFAEIDSRERELNDRVSKYIKKIDPACLHGEKLCEFLKKDPLDPFSDYVFQTHVEIFQHSLDEVPADPLADRNNSLGGPISMKLDERYSSIKLRADVATSIESSIQSLMSLRGDLDKQSKRMPAPANRRMSNMNDLVVWLDNIIKKLTGLKTQFSGAGHSQVR